MAQESNRWIGTQLHIIAIVAFVWGLYGVCFGELWILGKSKRVNALTGVSRMDSPGHTFSGGKARGMGLALMVGGIGLTLLNLSLKREDHSLAIAGIVLLGCGAFAFLGALIFLSY